MKTEFMIWRKNVVNPIMLCLFFIVILVEWKSGENITETVYQLPTFHLFLFSLAGMLSVSCYGTDYERHTDMTRNLLYPTSYTIRCQSFIMLSLLLIMAVGCTAPLLGFKNIEKLFVCFGVYVEVLIIYILFSFVIVQLTKNIYVSAGVVLLMLYAEKQFIEKGPKQTTECLMEKILMNENTGIYEKRLLLYFAIMVILFVGIILKKRENHKTK